jgi:hypothetical protein
VGRQPNLYLKIKKKGENGYLGRISLSCISRAGLGSLIGMGLKQNMLLKKSKTENVLHGVTV